MKYQELLKNINIWNKLWSTKNFNPNTSPTVNVEYFNKYHLPKKNKKKFKILDVGFGNGRNSFYLLNLGFNVYGIDSSKFVVKKIKEKLGDKKENFKLNSFTDIDFPDCYFDAVIAEASLYYGTKKDFTKGVKEIERVLKKDGIIRIYTASNRDKYYLNKSNATKIVKIKKNVWEKNLNLTFLSKKNVLSIFKNFKNLQLGLDEFNLINYKRKHSYWIITGNKKY